MIEEHLKLKPEQTELMPEQLVEARHFADERIQAQLSTEPVDEQEAEGWLRQAYQTARLQPPNTTLWLDGPLELVDLFVPSNVEASLDARDWARLIAGVGENVTEQIWNHAANSVAHDRSRLEISVRVQVAGQVRVGVHPGFTWLVRSSVQASLQDRVWDRMSTRARPRVKERLWPSIFARIDDAIKASARAYSFASMLAFCRFFAEYLAPNDGLALARFNELVSGYWLGKELALIVRRPTLLARDSAGRLHSATGPCIQYRDGWGFYAWHGVRVPEKVIMAPDYLTRDDYLHEQNQETRRLIQERMGSRFVSELGGHIIDSGSRGTLYEVQLPDDPERVARYVQVQDASTARQYFLRVPPTIQTAAEAWLGVSSWRSRSIAQHKRREVGRASATITARIHALPQSGPAHPVLRARPSTVAQDPDCQS